MEVRAYVKPANGPWHVEGNYFHDQLAERTRKEERAAKKRQAEFNRNLEEKRRCLAALRRTRWWKIGPVKNALEQFLGNYALETPRERWGWS